MAKAAKPLEVGATVSWTRRNGMPAKGMVVKVDKETPSGPWVDVNTAKNGGPPVISRLRPAVLKVK